MAKMLAAQRDHLMHRIAEVERRMIAAIPKESWDEPNPYDKKNEPPEVKKAHAVIEAWEERKRGRYDRCEGRRKKVEAPARAKAEKVRTVVLFKSPEEALAAVEKFEREHP